MTDTCSPRQSAITPEKKLEMRGEDVAELMLLDLA
jgi:hypothetical protein